MAVRTAEHNAKIAAALRGKPKSAEHKRRMAEHMRGKYSGPDNPNWRGGEWYDHSREKFQVSNASRLAHRHGVESTLTLDEWLGVLRGFGRSCVYCLKATTDERHQPNTLEIDHVTPMAKGGPNSQDNVVPACRSCNRRRGGKASGWVPSIASPFWPRLAEELYADQAMKERK